MSQNNNCNIKKYSTKKDEWPLAETLVIVRRYIQYSVVSDGVS